MRVDLLLKKDRPRLLVIDDDPGILFLAHEALEQAGFEVAAASSGTEGVHLSEELQPDLILLDILMPGCDGFTTCETIRKMESGPDIPILIMTGLDDMDSIDLAYNKGATDFITKPINWGLLVHRIRYMLRSSEANRELRWGRSRLANAQRIARIGHWDWDLRSNTFHWSEELYGILGLSAERASSQSFLSFVHWEDLHAVRDCMKDALAGKGHNSVEHRVMVGGNSTSFVHLQVEVTFDPKKKPIWMTGTVQDITERKRTEQQIGQLASLAYYDSLTGLPNRVLFKTRLKQAQAYAEQTGHMFAVIFLDLDLFKRFNDTLGHSMGDLLLRSVAERLISCVRKSDDVARIGPDFQESHIARLGGDEFTLLLTHIKEPMDAAKVARRILSKLAEPFKIEEHDVFLTASIGISVYPSDGLDAENLMKNADTAMYHAKSHGRNDFKFYTSSMGMAASERLALENSLRKAIEGNEFFLLYQPKFDIHSRKVTAVEALIRWHQPEQGILLPAEFIPMAEETGLILPIGEWVILSACKQNKAWQEAGFQPLRVAVNISSVQFRNPQKLMDVITHALTLTGLEPKYLELELTESLLMENEEESVATLKKLKGLGLRVSIDDFGMGYSSLSYLKRFPVDELKIDRSFLEDLTDESENAAITSAIIAMAHALKLKAIAEGVETEQQFNFLHEQGCDEVQGFLLGRPMSPDLLLNLMKGCPGPGEGEKAAG